MGYSAIVSRDVQAERLTICESCKWFKPNTRSCGTFIGAAFKGSVGEVEVQAVKDNKVKHYKKPIQLCGCRMDAKVVFAWAGCPADKWLPVRINKDELAELKSLAIQLKKQSSFHSTDEAFQKFLIFMRKLTGQNVQYTGCNDCVRQLLELAEQSVQDIEE